MDSKVRRIRNGIFSLNTRRFGTVAELMIKKLYNLDSSDSLAYDLRCDDTKIEVKFSTVLKSCKEPITSKNAVKQIINSNTENRMLTFEEAKKSAFDCNIQQVKPSEFKLLYYGCFFKDKIMICKIGKTQLLNDDKIFYSDHQHRGNVGEGQFHINNRTLNNHIEKYFVQWLTYEELYKLLK